MAAEGDPSFPPTRYRHPGLVFSTQAVKQVGFAQSKEMLRDGR
jgi:hypothetical protein